ncbi:MAG: hypothetical protein FWH29_04330 [Methanobrevibacter sp.]|nr:hypothetical protein [Methanobrevibacter sp.]
MPKSQINYKIEREIKTKIVTLAELKGVNQTELVEEYLKCGIEKDKELFKKLME